jgi:beta-lactamase class A
MKNNPSVTYRYGYPLGRWSFILMLMGLLVAPCFSSEPISSPPATFADEPTASPCGVVLPLFWDEVSTLPPVDSPPATLPANLPLAAVPAVNRILTAPHTVGLVAYQIGAEEDGIYLNADIPYPLASTDKIVHLYAYAEAVADGTLNPEAPIPLADLARYYLPNTDGGAHPMALQEAYQTAQVTGDPPALPLALVPRMMIRFSSNAATDYLHELIGQAALEQAVLELGMDNHTAPCLILGQFLVMSNTSRPDTPDSDVLRALRQDSAAYAEAIASLATRYTTDQEFRRAQTASWQETQRPSLADQHLFTQTLAVRGSARAYAAMMARIAQDDFPDPTIAPTLRSYLEWVMQFPPNQALFSVLGYKGGSLPGTLTGAYYAIRLDETAPIVVALFYSELPLWTYSSWLSDSPHDALARWLLSDPAALPALRDYLAPLLPITP